MASSEQIETLLDKGLVRVASIANVSITRVEQWVHGLTVSFASARRFSQTWYSVACCSFYGRSTMSQGLYGNGKGTLVPELLESSCRIVCILGCRSFSGEQE